MEHPDPGLLIHQTPPPAVPAPEGHHSLWICLLLPLSLCLVFSREDPAANPQHFKQTPQWFPELFIPRVFENININRSAQKFFHLLPAKGSLCCSARLETVVTFKGFPSLPPPPSFPPTPPTDHKPSRGSSWNLRAPKESQSHCVWKRPPKDPHLTATSMGSLCSIPTTPLPHCSSVKVQVPTGQIQRYFRIPLLFPSSFCLTHALSQPIFPELS